MEHGGPPAVRARMETLAEHLRSQARLCRAALNGTTDPRTREALMAMVLEYERKAAEAEARDAPPRLKP